MTNAVSRIEGNTFVYCSQKLVGDLVTGEIMTTLRDEPPQANVVAEMGALNAIVINFTIERAEFSICSEGRVGSRR